MNKKQALQHLLKPRSIAVIGASENNYFAVNLLKNLSSLQGTVYPVNPKRKEVAGLQCYSNLVELPTKPDCAVVVVGEKQLSAALQECVQVGIPVAIILSSIEAETDEGKNVLAEINRYIEDDSIHILGPNCLGIINNISGIVACASNLPAVPSTGEVGLIAQSGAMMLALQRMLQEKKVGTSFCVSTGNEKDLSFEDIFEYLVEDPSTHVICIYLETIRYPERFSQVCAKARQLKKPVLVLKIGRSAAGSRMAMAHTGAMAGSHEVYEAVFRANGVISVEDISDLVETTTLFAKWRGFQPKADGIAALVASGAVATMVADAAETQKINLPAFSVKTVKELQEILPAFTAATNPLDTSAQVRSKGEIYRQCVETLAKDPGVGVVMSVVALGLPGDKAVSHQVTTEYFAEGAVGSDKPFVISSIAASPIGKWADDYLSRTGLPYLRGVDQTFKSLKRWLEFRGMTTGKIQTLQTTKTPTKSNKQALGEWESMQALRNAGIPVVPVCLAANGEGAAAAARKLGYPVAVKLCSPDVPHKSDLGVIRLNLRNDREVLKACSEILRIVAEKAPAAKNSGFTIQKMIEGAGVEVILGSVRDSQFGPLVVVGAGGILTELLDDKVLLVPPLSRAEVKRAINGTRVGRLLSGLRGKPPCDVEPLIDACMNLADFAVNNPDIEEIDINPLIVLPVGQGCWAVDALIVKNDI